MIKGMPDWVTFLAILEFKRQFRKLNATATSALHLTLPATFYNYTFTFYLIKKPWEKY